MLSSIAARSSRPAAFARAARRAAISSPAWRAQPFKSALPLLWTRGMAKGSNPKNPAPRFSNAPKPPASSTSKPQQPVSALHKAPSTPQPTPEAPEAPKTPEDEPQQEIPLHKLPDLTQGIPSTLEYEASKSANRLSLSAVEEEEAYGAGGRGKGELPASAYISSGERKRQAFAQYAVIITAALIAAATVHAGRNWDEIDVQRHPDVPNGWGLGLWWGRASTRMKEFLTYYHEPAFEKLLPDMDPLTERPYTLVIGLEDLLVHNEWSREHGWRIAKRPGMDYFIRYLSQYYELVLFTSIPSAIADPLLRKIDPFRFIMWYLFNEATKYQDGEIVKDLSYLNRDLSKVVMLDTNARHVRAQPENAIVLPKWTGDPKDNDLVALIPFFEYVAAVHGGDVRKVLKSFEGKHIPTEFARREAIARAEFQKQIAAEKMKHPSRGGSGVGALGSLLGLRKDRMSMMVQPEGEPNVGEEFAKGKMLQDVVRERGQRGYEAMEKLVRENGEKWLKEEAEMMEKAQQEGMQSMKNSFSGWFTKEEPVDKKT